MKKKVMSPEALAAMVGSGESESEEQKHEAKDENLDTTGQESAEDNLDVDAGEGEEDVLDAMKELETFKAESEAKMAEKDEAIEAMKSGMESLKASTETLKSEASELKSIVCKQITNMRVGLQLSKVDMKEWGAAEVVKEYNSTSKSFVESFPVGSAVPDKVDSKQNADKQAKRTSLDMSAYKALGIK